MKTSKEKIAKPKSPKDSLVTMTEIVLPQHANALGTIFGGQLMSWIDVGAAIAAARHAGRICVTASIDELHFLAPIKVGHIVNIYAQVTAVHRTSCEVLVSCWGEERTSGSKFLVAKAFLTFVGVNDAGVPMPMPQLLVKTPEEKKLQSQGILRRAERIKLKAKLEGEV